MLNVLQPNKPAQAVWLCMLETSGSDLGNGTDYSDGHFWWLCSILPEQMSGVGTVN